MKWLMCVMVMGVVSAQADPSGLTIDFKWQDSIASLSNKNVVDYYLLLPKSFLDCEDVANGLPEVSDRMEAIKVHDVKNGYLRFFAAAEIALFKDRKNDVDILAVQIGKSGMGATCGAINTLLRFDTRNKTWQYCDSLIPASMRFEPLYERYSNDDIFPYYKLPRFGRDIVILDEETDRCLDTLRWNGTSFEVSGR